VSEANVLRFRQRQAIKAAVETTPRALLRMATHIEYVESVACAFAWDLAVRLEELKESFRSSDPASSAVEDADMQTRDAWDDALRALGDETKR